MADQTDEFSVTFQSLQRETLQTFEMRRPYLDRIRTLRDGRAVVSFFISFDSQIPLTQADADMLEELLINADTSKGVTLILDAPGGDGLAAERIVQVCRTYSNGDFETIVPARAKSAATMVCLGSDRVLMSPTSELGPIDPQVVWDLGDGPRWVAAHYITKTYDRLFAEASGSADTRIEPYLQQLSIFNPVHVEQLRSAAELAVDIAVCSLKLGMMSGVDEAKIKNQIKPFTDPELTMSHGRGINYERAKECGLEVEVIDVTSELWHVIWGLYLRSKFVVNTSGTPKLIDTLEGSYAAALG